MTTTRPTTEHVAAFRSAFVALFPKNGIVIIECGVDQSHDGYGKSYENVLKPNLNEILRYVMPLVKKGKLDGIPKNMKDVFMYINDSYEMNGYEDTFIETTEDNKKREREKLRARLEPIVSYICAKYKVKHNSLSMVSAIHKHYSNIIKSESHFCDDGESRAERWMDAMHSGCSESFYDDNFYSSSIIAESRETFKTIMNYLYENFPLLTAEWEERRKKLKSDRLASKSRSEKNPENSEKNS